MNSVFAAKTYKAYLNAVCGRRGTRSGVRSALARASGCNTAYVSRVLGGDADFSLEQALRVSAYLKHDAAESAFFLLLVQRDRAGTRELRRHFEGQIKSALERHRSVKNHLGPTHELSVADQSKYYRSWVYAAVHVATSVAELRDRATLAARLGLPVVVIDEALAFLLEVGLLENKNGRLGGGPAHVHLGADADLITRHHVNWRVRALRALDALDRRNLHYSAVTSVSREDFGRIKDVLLGSIKTVTTTITDSADEDLAVLNLDWFRL